MSARINIDVNGFVALKQQADKVAQINKDYAVETDQNRKLGAQADQQQATQSLEAQNQRGTTSPQSNSVTRRDKAPQTFDALKDRRNDVPTTELTRELAATATGASLTPFAVQWKGDITYQPQTVWEGLLFPEAVYGEQPTSTVTYSGGHRAVTRPFEVAASSSIVQVAQEERYTEWQTVPKLCLSVCGPSTWVYEGWWAESITVAFYSVVPGASLSNPVYLTQEFYSSPVSNGPVGPISHGVNGEYLAVKSDGTIFVVVRLPWEPVNIQTTDLAREVYLANPGTSSPAPVDGKQQKTLSGQYNGNAVRTGYPSIPLYKFEQTQPILFIRAKGGKIESKTVGYDPSQSFATFFYDNAYTDDPGRNLRSSYAGEVRVRGQKAHKLRMRYEEVYEGDTYVWYEDFPYASLTGFVTGTGAQARLQAGVTFEDHIYTLSSYSTDAELATQLAAIKNPTSYQDQPEYLPDKVVPVKVPSSFLATAAKRLSTEGADDLTPLTYFVAMP